MATQAQDAATVLVIGASGGGGRSVVDQLLSRGYRVLGSVLNQTELESFKATDGPEAQLFVADFADAERGALQVKEAIARSGRSLGAVISCIGVNPCGPLETSPLAEFRKIMEINTIANLAVYQVTLPSLRASGGRMIFTSSLSGKVAMPLLGYYTASKFALEGLADTMRLEAGQWGVGISLVQPGAILTDMVFGFGAHLDSRLAALNDDDQANYRAYFEQYRAFTEAVGAIAISAEQAAAKLIEALESETLEPRYAIGSSVDLIDKRIGSTDQEMDAMMNEIFPGSR